MKNLIYILIAAVMVACGNDDKKEEKHESYNNLEFKVPNKRMTPETLWALGRVGNVTVSPDKTKVLYTVSWYSVEQNKSFSDIYVKDINIGDIKQLTFSDDVKEQNVIWRPDGKKIGFISGKSGRSQIWEIDPDGKNARIITDIPGDVDGFIYAPDQTHIAYAKKVKVEPNVHDLYPDLPKANAKLMDDLMYRHWDEWVNGEFSHIFITNYNYTNKELIGEGTDIMKGEPWESPMRPFGGMEQLSWSPDGKKLAYTARKKKGIDYATSTNSDIYLYDLESASTTNLSEENKGYDKNPVFSGSGNMIAWESMERDGYEADVNRLIIHDFVAETDFIYENDDLNVSSLTWDANDEGIYFISDWHARDHIYRFDLLNKENTQLTKGDFDYTSVHVGDGNLIATRMSISHPTDIYLINKETGEAKNLSNINKPILDQLTMGKVEERWVKTTDNKDMLVWVIYPPNFDPNKKYPTLLYCQGGPQGTVSQFWSYRWNFQIMAANDYIIVAPNRRGLPGFGKRWNEQISGDYGGQNIKDYLSAIDAVAKEKYVDNDKLGAVGASYGGYSVLYLAGHHEGRFKAFIDHDGMFNFESMYLETEELWFPNFDIGGPFWDKNNYRAQRSYRFSPHNFVDNWDTPILIIQGGKDFRVPESQGFMAFTAAKIKGIPAELLYFPDENHWVLSPQNGVLWQRTFFNWLDKWLK
ncbi:prolyl oligopeptidase family serine peptidase [Saccharicrinis sp. FJH62]|uniref:S9 family peptidase n=1 Tax=Saccharicrinis sp. FJH62 TaxID=3344657 RepID=UPI0035D46EA8